MTHVECDCEACVTRRASPVLTTDLVAAQIIDEILMRLYRDARPRTQEEAVAHAFLYLITASREHPAFQSRTFGGLKEAVVLA